MKKFLALFILTLALFGFATKSASASEGIVELRNTVGGQSRCFATSVLMPDFNYNVLITCRDLIYPVSSEVLTYIVWATPLNSRDAIKLGELNFGKVQFKTKTSFSNIFITQEKDDNKNVKFPAGQVAMRGNVQAIEFLDRPQENIQEEISSPEPTASPVPQPNQTSNTVRWLRTGGLITVVSIFIIIMMLILVKPFK